MITILLVISILAALLPLAGRSFRSISLIALACTTVVFGLSAYVSIPVLLGGPISEGAGFWYLDGLGALLMLLIGFVQWTASLASVSYLRDELHEKEITIGQVRRYYGIAGFFVLSMLTLAASDNLGVMWIALEATTLMTTFLVAFYSREGSLEAAWKYLILCSTGISLGLLGLLITYYGASSGGLLSGLSAMRWSELMKIAPHLSPSLMNLAFAFIIIGFGAKAGIAPMHTWLPDAHSRAPSPISGMLSSVLLSSALFGILRFKAIVDAAHGSSVWSNELFLVFGVITCALPAAFIISQVDYKRLLAYSSVEHMGLIFFAIGLGTYGAVVAVAHMVAHILAKSALFFGAGSMLVRFKSTKFKRMGNVMRVMPITGALFLTTLLALLAVPPSPIFFTEYLVVAFGISTHPVLTAVILLSLAVIFAGFIRWFIPMMYHKMLVDDGRADFSIQGERWNGAHTAMFLHVVALAAFGALLWTGIGFSFIQGISSFISI